MTLSLCVIFVLHLCACKAQTLVFGQSAAFTGHKANLGLDVQLGLVAAFEQTNNGHELPYNLSLLSFDDRHEIEPCVNNTQKLIEQDVFALIGYLGTATASAVIPISLSNQIPFIGALSGAKFLRSPYERYVVNFRGSYMDEAAAIVHHLAQSLQLTRISVFQEDSAEDVRQSLEIALRDQQLVIYGRGIYKRNTLDVEEGLESIRRATTELGLGSPQAIVMIGDDNALAKFVKLAKQYWPDVLFSSLSFVDSYTFSSLLGDAESRKNL